LFDVCGIIDHPIDLPPHIVDADGPGRAVVDPGKVAPALEHVRAQLAAMTAALEAQDILIRRLAITAPVDARVEALPWKTGSQPPRGATVAVLLADSAPYAHIYIPAAQRGVYREGANVTVRVPGFGDFAGTVRWVSSDAAFTPYFALTEHDRSRLSFAGEIRLEGDDLHELPNGLPIDARPAQAGH
jgi:HlyD family secretion protein